MVLSFLKALIQTEGIVVPDREIKLSGVIDNEAVLYRIQTAKLKGAGLCLRDEWEIFHEATQVCNQLAITPYLVHVKSHQDASIPYTRLSRSARLNVDADRLAEAAHSLPRPVLRMMPREKVALRIGGR
jgi:hypothetical protein